MNILKHILIGSAMFITSSISSMHEERPVTERYCYRCQQPGANIEFYTLFFCMTPHYEKLCTICNNGIQRQRMSNKGKGPAKCPICLADFIPEECSWTPPINNSSIPTVEIGSTTGRQSQGSSSVNHAFVEKNSFIHRSLTVMYLFTAMISYGIGKYIWKKFKKNPTGNVDNSSHTDIRYNNNLDQKRRD